MTIEQAKELRQSETWAAFFEEINHRVDLLFEQMAACKPEQLVALQARVQQLKEIQKLPEAVIESEE